MTEAHTIDLYKFHSLQRRCHSGLAVACGEITRIGFFRGPNAGMTRAHTHTSVAAGK